MIARLKPGATIAEAQAQIDAHNDAVEKDNSEAKMMAEAGFRSLVVPLHADHVRSIRPTLLLMQGGVFFLLLIGAVNLINLFLIRASDRARIARHTSRPGLSGSPRSSTMRSGEVRARRSASRPVAVSRTSKPAPASTRVVAYRVSGRSSTTRMVRIEAPPY